MTIALSDVSVAFCDSIEALNRAWADGLPKQARIRTSSPALYAAGHSTVEPLDAAHSNVDPSAYWEAGSALTRSAHAALEQCPDTAASALLIARATLSLHRLLQKAIWLGPDDFSAPRAALLVDSGTPARDAVLNPPWADFFIRHDRFVCHRSPIADAVLEPAAEAPFSLRLRQFDLSRLINLASMHFGRWRGGKGRLQRRVIVFRKNELVEDVVCSMARRGYLGHTLRASKTSVDPDSNLVTRIEERLLPVFGAFLDLWFAPQIVPAARTMLRREIEENLQAYTSTLADWRSQLKPFAGGRSLVVTNFPGRPEGLSLAAVCREYGLPFVVAQHGVTREISASHGPVEVYFENGSADLFLTFNERAKTLTERSPFASGQCKAVGLPRAYSRLRRLRRRKGAASILYVSTALLKGNVNLATGGVGDIERVARERTIVNDVLAKLPATVMYKTYPSRDRYTDPDPLLADLGRHRAIKVFKAHTDLRYFVGEHEVLIASRATSTIGWCLMADRPFVFIDFPDDSPLAPEAREAFEAGLFVFDWRDPAMLDRLRRFLSRPIADIRADWAAKNTARSDLIRDFFSGHPDKAGNRAAAAIMDLAPQIWR